MHKHACGRKHVSRWRQRRTRCIEGLLTSLCVRHNLSQIEAGGEALNTLLLSSQSRIEILQWNNRPKTPGSATVMSLPCVKWSPVLRTKGTYKRWICSQAHTSVYSACMIQSWPSMISASCSHAIGLLVIAIVHALGKTAGAFARNMCRDEGRLVYHNIERADKSTTVHYSACAPTIFSFRRPVTYSLLIHALPKPGI